MSSAISRKRWAWVSGWGVPIDTFSSAVQARWPNDEHVVFTPDAYVVQRLRSVQADVLAGYSLGALLLLSAEPWPDETELLAIAPILAFDAEAALGGLTPAATRELMRTKIEAKPEAMLKLFQRLAGLNGLATTPLPCSVDDLVWGLDALGSLRAHPDNTRRARLYAGARDPLVSASQLRPHTDALMIVEDAGHDFRELLPAVALHHE